MKHFKSIFEIQYEDFKNYEDDAKPDADFSKVFDVYFALEDAGLADTAEAKHLANILQI